MWLEVGEVKLFDCTGCLEDDECTQQFMDSIFSVRRTKGKPKKENASLKEVSAKSSKKSSKQSKNTKSTKDSGVVDELDKAGGRTKGKGKKSGVLKPKTKRGTGRSSIK